MRDSSSPLSIELPKGVKDFLPISAGKMKLVVEQLVHTFELWGYQGVITPSFEYLDVLEQAEPELVERMFKFEDRASGKVLAMRPDFTAQVARLAASHLKDHPKPLRLHYSGSILHYGERDLGGRREIYQAGLEMIGLDLPESDGEIIAVTIAAISSTGVTDFKIDVGQVEFFRGVMEGLGLTLENRKEVEMAVARKDRSGIEALLPRLKLKDSDEEALLALPTLFGDRSILDKAANLISNTKSEAALNNLSEVLDTVEMYGCSDYITVDLGEIRGLNYYTGTIFEGFVQGMGDAVCGGGRYNSLLSHYGYDTPATGFAIDVESIVKALECQGRPAVVSGLDCLLLNGKKDKGDALKLARFLRSKGVKTCRDISRREIAASIEYARNENISKVVIVSGEGAGADELLVLDLADETKKIFKIDAVLEGRTDIVG
jgi:ATP phosphoribosyltransferase regulatory subunit